MYSNKKTIAAAVVAVIIIALGLAAYFLLKPSLKPSPKPSPKPTGTVEIEPLNLEQFGDITVTETEAWNQLADSLEDENAN